MPDKYKRSPRIGNVRRDAILNIYEAPITPPTPPTPPFRPGRWLYAIAAALALGGGTFVTTQLSARTVYYCASHHTVKYHTDATCLGLTQCGARVKSMPLGKARSRMELCKMCH
jgi:hypothetical protein